MPVLGHHQPPFTLIIHPLAPMPHCHTHGVKAGGHGFVHMGQVLSWVSWLSSSPFLLISFPPCLLTLNLPPCNGGGGVLLSLLPVVSMYLKKFVSNKKMKWEKEKKTYLGPKRGLMSLGPFFVIPIWYWVSHCPLLLLVVMGPHVLVGPLAPLSSGSSSSCCRCMWSHSVGPALSHHHPPHEQLLVAVEGVLVVIGITLPWSLSLLLFHLWSTSWAVAHRTWVGAVSFPVIPLLLLVLSWWPPLPAGLLCPSPFISLSPHSRHPHCPVLSLLFCPPPTPQAVAHEAGGRQCWCGCSPLSPTHSGTSVPVIHSVSSGL